MKNLLRLPVFPILLIFTGLLVAETPSAVAIRNARIVPVSGPAIAKGTVVVRNGLIESVGENVAVPADAWIVEGDGLTVYPGLIDALSTWGLPDAATPATPAGRGAAGPATPTAVPAIPPAPPARGPQDRPGTSSWLHAADLIKTTDRRLETVRSGGFTTAVTFPNRGIFAGQGAVIDLAGETTGQMVVAEPMGQYMTMVSAGFGSYPSSLMGVIGYIRQIYIDADYYTLQKKAYAANPRGLKRPEYDRALEGVIESPWILLPASRLVEMDRMLRFAAELKKKVILYGGQEGYRAGELLSKAHTPVLVNLKWPEKARDGDPDAPESLRTMEVRDKAPSTPAVLVKNGVPFAFYSGGIDQPRDLFKAVKRAIDAGLSADQALRAMTLSPAEIYGVADRLGSIEKGKIANLVVAKGELFQDKPEIKFVFVDGVKFVPAPVPEEAPRRPGAPDAAEPPPPSIEREVR